MSKRLVVWLTVTPEREHDFNRWYEQDYIPRFVKQIPGINAVSRWRVPGTTTYLTIYDLADATTLETLRDALRSPARHADREEWHRWETAHLTDFRDGFFEKVFEHVPTGRASA